MKNKEDYEPFRDLAEQSKDRLVKLGFPQFTLEDFHDTVSGYVMVFRWQKSRKNLLYKIVKFSSHYFSGPVQFMTVVQRVAPSDNEEETLNEMHKLFNEQGYSDYVVVYLRLITSGQLQEGVEFYQNFIDGNCTMEEFRHQEVEPMYKESDHIHIIGRSRPPRKSEQL